MSGFKRRKDLDRRDDEFGLLISYAMENLQTGQIEYWWDNQLGMNYQEIDKRKGRRLSGWIDDLPVYVSRNDQEQAKQLKKMVDCFCYSDDEEQKRKIIEAIKISNKSFGYDEENRGYL